MRIAYRTISAAFVVSLLIASSMHVAMGASAESCNEARPASPAAAVKALVDGNARWSSGKPIHSGRDFARRECVAKEGQTPFAAILACADSRVPPELLFDEGVGDLFVVRVAGNSIDKLGQQSLEYAADHLGAATILVLGHSSCGAVKAAVNTYPAAAPEFLSLVYSAIERAKELMKGRGGNSDDKEALVRESIDQHVILEVNKLRAEHPFNEMIQKGKLKIVGGRYDLDTGRVTMLIE
jgi:carbonic anhydrase